MVTLLTMGGCTLPSLLAGHEELTPGVEQGLTLDEHGREIAFLRSRDATGPRVIFIHGTPGSARVFMHYLDRADAPVGGGGRIAFEGVSVDRPGWGRTGGPATPSLAEQADAIEPLLVEKGGVAPVVVGYSFGGPVAVRVAAEHPDRVGAVVVLGGALDPDLEQTIVFQYIGNFALFPALLPRWLRTTNREALSLRRELEELGAMLDEVRCPVIILHGTEDDFVTYENVEYMQRMLVNSERVEVVRIAGEGHFLPWRQENAVRDAIGRALRDAGAGVIAPAPVYPDPRAHETAAGPR